MPRDHGTRYTPLHMMWPDLAGKGSDSLHALHCLEYFEHCDEGLTRGWRNTRVTGGNDAVVQSAANLNLVIVKNANTAHA